MKLSHITKGLAHPVAIAIVAGGFGVAHIIGFADDTLTFVLSVLALTFSQLVLADGNRFAEGTSAKLDEIIKAIPAARNELMRAEEKAEADIEKLRPS